MAEVLQTGIQSPNAPTKTLEIFGEGTALPISPEGLSHRESIHFGNWMHSPLPQAIITGDSLRTNTAFNCLTQERAAREAFVNTLNQPVITAEGNPISLLEATRKGIATPPVEIQIGGAWYRMHVHPFPGGDNEMNVGVSMIDISPDKLEISRLTSTLRAEARRWSEIMARIAHDVKAPLACMKGFAQLTIRSLNRKGPGFEREREWLETAVSVNDRTVIGINGQIDSLRQSPELRREIISISQLVGTVLAEHSGQIEHDGIEVAFSLPEEELKFVGDPNSLASTIRALISNAIQAMDGCGEKKLSIAARISNDKIVVIVKDTGSGIPEENRKKVFEGWSSKRGTDQKGTGVGLSQAREIIRLHGGELSIAESVTPQMLQIQPGLKETGTTMVFTLPFLEEVKN